MRQKFVLRVKEKEAELKESERELHAKFDKLKVSVFQEYCCLLIINYFLINQATVADEKRVVEDQRRALDEEIADFQRRKAQYESDKMNSGHHTLTLGKLGKKKQNIVSVIYNAFYILFITNILSLQHTQLRKFSYVHVNYYFYC